MIIKLTEHGRDEFSVNESAAIYASDGVTKMSSAGVSTCDSRFCGKYIKTMKVGGVNTDPEYRREGCVRKIFDELFKIAPERGWVVSMLHPFSFSYYRMFGYEKICDHRILRFPISKLEFAPRRNDLVKLAGKERLGDVLDIYSRFGESRSIMFRRYNAADFPLEPKKDERSTYIWYDEDKKPASYITLGVENEFYINRMESINLNVYEMAFTSRESLMALFGFMRMYEGENDTVKIHNCGMSPEIDAVLRHYTHTKYTLIPDIMARILDVKAFLEANEYPACPGTFTVKVNDTLDYTRGVYRVEYASGEAEVKKLGDGDTDYDISADMPAFTQLVYGYDSYDARLASYMHGVALNNDCADFFRAFPRRPAGLFEHF